MHKMAAESIGQWSSGENKNSGGRISTRMSAFGGKADIARTHSNADDTNFAENSEYQTAKIEQERSRLGCGYWAFGPADFGNPSTPKF